LRDAITGLGRAQPLIGANAELRAALRIIVAQWSGVGQAGGRGKAIAIPTLIAPIIKAWASTVMTPDAEDGFGDRRTTLLDGLFEKIVCACVPFRGYIGVVVTAALLSGIEEGMFSAAAVYWILLRKGWLNAIEPGGADTHGATRPGSPALISELREGGAARIERGGYLRNVGR
jgi:hypothetical protein